MSNLDRNPYSYRQKPEEIANRMYLTDKNTLEQWLKEHRYYVNRYVNQCEPICIVNYRNLSDVLTKQFCLMMPILDDKQDDKEMTSKRTWIVWFSLRQCNLRIRESCRNLLTVSKTALALCYKSRDEISKENPNYGEIDRLSQSLQQEMEGAVLDDEEDIVLDSDVKESGPPEDDEVVD
ncbi:unnamed protein product [Caenorhabditis nigoni]